VVTVRFWGTRGSIPSPGRDKAFYGGNTPCIELGLPGGGVFVLDGGTGLRELGNALLSREGRIEAHVFFTHYHWDHIQGLPFFVPAYRAGHSFTLMGPEHPGFSLEKIISSQMESIHFPVGVSSLSAAIAYRTLTEGEHSVAGVPVHVLRVNHPGINYSYKVCVDGLSVVYMTDHELLPGKERGASHIAFDRSRIVRFVEGADLLIHDAQYDDEEYKEKEGWGHSTWREAVKFALDGAVKRLVLFHHDPDHADPVVDSFVKQARKEIAEQGAEMECWGARESDEIAL
jgi:phosphoribosyl 1,2-cyclic phosphodiesterase